MTSFHDDLIGQRERRLAQLKSLKDQGINPYPSKARKDYANIKLHEQYNELEGKEMVVAGRIKAIREHGKLEFWTLTDQSATIQIVLKASDLQEPPQGYLGWEKRKVFDVGDYIEVIGVLGKTTRGEVSLFAHGVRILAKTLRPLPQEFTNKEERYRRRYVDMKVNEEVVEIFKRKAKFWQAMRSFLNEEGFHEIFLPVLEHTTGGADARPFITHYNELKTDVYLRISLELFSKRAIGGGMEKVYSIGPVFRNEGMSEEHANEYNMLEYYWAYADYEKNMELVQKLYLHVAKAVYGTTTFTTRGHTFNLQDNWTIIDYTKAIKDFFQIDIFTATEEEMRAALKEEGLTLKGANRTRLIDNLWKVIRKTIAGPAFLVNQPAFISPLAKSHENNPLVTERFQVILGGSEVGNGYSEINNPLEQLERFLEQQKLREQGDDEAQMLDIDFVEMLEYGMPPTTGFGVSERLFWFLEGITAREGTMFPLLAPETEAITKKIYGPVLNEITPASLFAHKGEEEKVELTITRKQALALLEQKIPQKNLINHCLAVEAFMRALARHFHKDEDLWGMAGLLHDADWEVTRNTPTEHTLKTIEWLGELNETNKELINAILSHAHHVTGKEGPKTLLEWALYCGDELTGLIVATTLMQPTKKLADVSVESVLKKFKTKAFASGVDRTQIALCEEKLGIPLKKFIEICLTAMQRIAPQLGL